MSVCLCKTKVKPTDLSRLVKSGQILGLKKLKCRNQCQSACKFLPLRATRPITAMVRIARSRLSVLIEMGPHLSRRQRIGLDFKTLLLAGVPIGADGDASVNKFPSVISKRC